MASPYKDHFKQAVKKEFDSRNSGLNFDNFYNEYTRDDYWKKQAGHDGVGGTTNHAVFYHNFGDKDRFKKAIGIDIDNWTKANKNLKAPTVAESTIQAQSTQQANLRAQQTGTPDANNQVSESQKDTETKRRQNKAKGKRGFVVARESGQGINI